MKTLPIVVICLLIFSDNYCQNRSFGTLPMVQKPKGSSKSRIADNNSADTLKYQRALKVYNKLVEARGDFRYPVPNFIMSKSDGYVASMDYNKLEIDLEEKAYNVCLTFGDSAEAAIAFLLGHELSHYYEKHAWKRGFVADFKDLPIGMKLDSIQDDVRNETEADYIGGFLAYSAGFGYFDKGSAIISALYKEYGLPNKIKGYPSLQDRQTMSVRTAEKLKKLIQVFDMANLLTAVGNYSEAYEYYRYVLLEYQSREIYNNLGVCALLDALKYFNASDLKFKYPIQIDLNSSAKEISGFLNEKQRLIKQALLHFDAAISLDPNYAPAYINKACAYALLGDTDRARFYAEKEARSIVQKNAEKEARSIVQKNMDAKTNIDIDILIGILEATNGKTERAKELFESAAKAGSALAKMNLRILNNEIIEPEVPAFRRSYKAEQIDSQNLKELILEDKFVNMKSMKINKNIYFHSIASQGPSSFIFIGQNDATNTYFHCTKPNYKGKTSRDINLNSSRDDIVLKYGEPSSTIETPTGQILVYKSVLFILGKQNKLDRWVIYQEEE